MESFSFDVMKKRTGYAQCQQYAISVPIQSIGYDLGVMRIESDAVSRTGFTLATFAYYEWGNERSNYRANISRGDAKVSTDVRGREEYGARAALNQPTASGTHRQYCTSLSPIVIRQRGMCFGNAIEANPTTPLLWIPNDPSKYYNFQDKRQAIIRLK